MPTSNTSALAARPLWPSHSMLHLSVANTMVLLHANQTLMPMLAMATPNAFAGHISTVCSGRPRGGGRRQELPATPGPLSHPETAQGH